jgi:FkbM family methyltransferase
MVVKTKRGPISFLVHDKTAGKRAGGLLSKEPHSLEWIDAMPAGSVFWDIGACTGTLSLYAASRGDLDVWAFEPAAVNYYNLTANCELNGFKMRCLLLGFGERTELGELHVSQFMPAKAFSFKGKSHKAIASRQYAMIWSIDEFMDRFSPPCPNYIKIDIHGLTEAIISGARKTLLRPELKQLQIEAHEKSPLVATLAKAGFTIIAQTEKNSLGNDLVFGRSTWSSPLGGAL